MFENRKRILIMAGFNTKRPTESLAISPLCLLKGLKKTAPHFSDGFNSFYTITNVLIAFVIV